MTTHREHHLGRFFKLLHLSVVKNQNQTPFFFLKEKVTAQPYFSLFPKLMSTFSPRTQTQIAPANPSQSAQISHPNRTPGTAPRPETLSGTNFHEKLRLSASENIFFPLETANRLHMQNGVLSDDGGGRKSFFFFGSALLTFDLTAAAAAVDSGRGSGQ